jgi:hypothetical protein
MPDVCKIFFSEDAFVAAIAGELATPGVTPLAASSRIFGASLLGSLREAVGSRLIKDPAISKGTWPARYETLEKTSAHGGGGLVSRTPLFDASWRYRRRDHPGTGSDFNGLLGA